MENRPPINQKLQNRLAAYFTLLAVLTAGLVTGILFLGFREQLRDDVRRRLLDVASLAVLQIDVEQHARLTDPGQESSPEYARLKRQLQQIRRAGADITYVYTMRAVNGKAVFIADAEEDAGNATGLGDIYYESDEEFLEILTGLDRPVVEQEFFTDRSGTYLSAYAPLVAPDGRLDGILGIDLSVENMVRSERRLMQIALIVFLVPIPLVAGAGYLLGKNIAAPIVEITRGAERIAEGDLEHRVAVHTRDETGRLADTFNWMAQRLRSVFTNLEGNVAERTRELVRRSEYLEAAGEVAGAVNSILDSEELIHQVVTSIKDRFNFYYAGLFILDETGEWAVLRSGTGQEGRDMPGREHRIRFGEGLVGWCIANQRARVASQAQGDRARFDTADLPRTRSEASLPLRARNRVLGALAVQSELPGTFDNTLMEVLQAVADQVAVALDNARLFEETRSHLENARRTYSEAGGRPWLQLARREKQAGYRYDANGPSALAGGKGDDWESAPLPSLSLPITVRGESLGSVLAHKPAGTGDWSGEEIALLQTLVYQLEAALESARLFEDTQRQAAREQLIGEVTTRIRETLDVDLVLQTAAREMRRALGLAEVEMRLGPASPPSNGKESSGGPEGKGANGNTAA